eukprot:9097056-Lingulodinium_polyedra.AAC.1
MLHCEREGCWHLAPFSWRCILVPSGLVFCRKDRPDERLLSLGPLGCVVLAWPLVRCHGRKGPEFYALGGT